MRLYLFLIILSCFLDATGDELRINELYAGDMGLTSNYSLSGHWIEFFNDSDSAVNTDHYSLKLKHNLAWKLDLPGTLLSPGNFFVQFLTNSVRIGEVLYLFRSDSILIDSIAIVPLMAFQSLARVPDGKGEWEILKVASQNAPNYPDYPHGTVHLNDWIKYGHAPFFRRDGAGAIVFNNEMWLLSGWEHGPLSTEIWKSKNGLDWEFVTNAPWLGRHQAGFIVFDDKMWVISGDLIPDVWSSSDGINWQLVTDDAPWGERYAPYVVVYDDKIWLMGGMNYPLTSDGLYDIANPNQFNDVWSTTNGKDWTLVTEHAAWAPRSMILGSVVFNNKMWIMGGGVKGYETISEYNDVWNSTDGIHWTKVTDSAGWAPRVHMSTIVYNDKIWVTDGSPGHPSVLTNEVWSSSDGINWTRQETLNRWSPRHATSLFDFDGSLWVVAGFNNNDVWRYTDPPRIFYSKPTGDITDIENWTTSKDGVGEKPANFTNSNQIFVLTNRAEFYVSGDFTVSGVGSKLIVGDDEDSVVLSVAEGANLDATVDVSAGSSLIIYSLNIPKLGKVGLGSTVSFFTNGNFEIPVAAYYNLYVDAKGIATVPEDIAVFGTFHCLSGTLKCDQSGQIRLYGDIYVDNETVLTDAKFRFLGEQDQHISSSSNTLYLTAAKIYKTRGQLYYEELDKFVGLEMKIYPNPSKGDIRIKVSQQPSFKDIYLEVYDVSGRFIREQKYSYSPDLEYFELNGLRAGFYIFRIKIGGQSRSDRVLVQ